MRLVGIREVETSFFLVRSRKQHPHHVLSQFDLLVHFFEQLDQLLDILFFKFDRHLSHLIPTETVNFRTVFKVEETPLVGSDNFHLRVRRRRSIELIANLLLLLRPPIC
jgi:hypothetical protein